MSEAEMLEKARAMIKDDIVSTFQGVKPPVPDESDKEDDNEAEDDSSTDKKESDKEDSESDDGADVNDKKSEDNSDGDKDTDKDGDKDTDNKKDDNKDDKSDEDTDADDDSTLKVLADQNKALLEQIEDLSGQVFASPTSEEPDKVEDKKDDKVEDKAIDKKPDEPYQFVDQETFEDSLSSAKNLNTLLTKVASVAADEGERRGYERAIRETPSLVEKLTEKSVGVREAVRDFLAKNEDLVPVRKYVGLITNELRAKNPDWSLEQLFEEAGKVVREKLKLSKVVEELNDDKGSDGQPAFTKRGGGAGGKARQDTLTKLSPLQKEIGELADFAAP